MTTKKLKTSPSFGDLVPLAWADIPLYKWLRVHFTLSFLQASLHLTKDSSDMVFAMNQKEGKLFTWMSLVWDSSSKPRMRQGNCQRCRRSAWTTTAPLFQAFLQQDNTRQISVSTSVTKSFTFTWQCYVCQDQDLLLCFQNNPPSRPCETCVQPSVLLPPAPHLGSAGWQHGQGKGSSHFSVQAQPDQNSSRAKIRSLDFCFSEARSKHLALGLCCTPVPGVRLAQNGRRGSLYK